MPYIYIKNGVLDETNLYTDGEFIEYEELPERILLQSGFTRTNLAQLTNEQLLDINIHTLVRTEIDESQLNKGTDYLETHYRLSDSVEQSVVATYSIKHYSQEEIQDILEEKRESKKAEIIKAYQNEEDTATITWVDEEDNNTEYQIPVDDETKDTLDRTVTILDMANDPTMTSFWNYDRHDNFIELTLSKAISIGEVLTQDSLDRSIKFRNLIIAINSATTYRELDAINW